MNGGLCAWVIKKAWKIDMKVLQKFKNYARLNREPVKIFQKWDRMGKPSRSCDNASVAFLDTLKF